MAKPDEPRGRFAPIPIETTYESYRKSPRKQHSSHTATSTTAHTDTPQRQSTHIGPAPVPTPDASPRSQSPAAAGAGTTDAHGGQRRRFAPQLIESSRRARRVGDAGPATRPTDKTDITPYTKNIYTASKPKVRRGGGGGLDSAGGADGEGGQQSRPKPHRRESEEEAVQEYLLQLAAKEAALAVFPNIRAREGGVTHFYYRESSGSENSPEAASPADDDEQQQQRHMPRTRRKSSSLGLSWWHKYMQEHAQRMAVDDGDDQKEEEREEKPEEQKLSPADQRGQDISMMSDAELDSMDLSAPPDPLWTTSRRPSYHRDSMTDSSAIAGGAMGPPAPPHLLRGSYREDSSMTDAAPLVGRAPEMPFPSSAFKAPAAPAQAPSAAPPIGFGRPFAAFGMKPDSAQAQRLRKMASPPMLGRDLTFRRCPSPKATKLEPSHPFVFAHDDSRYRDVSGNGGLWHGYCYRTPSGRETTVNQPGGDGDHAMPMTEEPSSADQGVEEQRRQQKPTATADAEEAEAERNAKIAKEFNDEFVTQIYNYLSLGYPATAGVFDEELCKVSHISVAELRSRDEEQMAMGHMVDMPLHDDKGHSTCPRWRALKVYVTEWARQHPNLDDLDPLAWGVRRKSGGWGF
ncbi:hypothetical protein GMORB2_7574 [Geosmithia morbida]|uniref:Uncharacterized protein n=1 Tax=Geosmithia morbida TaxID=1094350 RepID=A0A9P5D2Y9_9HYPO|nr:uncharacterized protein GMORB2_7574 [Geosmithia morbida]KAF4121981.1 hypothetical protein GMORB2_7574 [Geosmithia morbida]